MAFPELEELRASLLGGNRLLLTPEQGDEAFERHMLLAARIHRAARLNQANNDGDGEAWVRYFEQHFSPFRALEAKLLWDEWRCKLLKDETPGGGIGISHGSARTHWTRDEDGVLFINLESMWDDFEASVDSFIASLAVDPKRRKIVLARYQARAWTVQPFVPVRSAGLQLCPRQLGPRAERRGRNRDEREQPSAEGVGHGRRPSHLRRARRHAPRAARGGRCPRTHRRSTASSS